MKLIFLFLLTAWGVCAEETKITYDNYRVYRIQPLTRANNEFLINLSQSLELDFWTDPNRVGNPVDVMVKPSDHKIFENTILKNGMTSEVLIENVQELADAQKVGDFQRNRAMTWTSYYTLNDIYAWLDEVAAANPGKVTVVNGGSTSQGRQIKGVRIAINSGKRAIFMEGGIHAREWVSPATITWLINELLTTTDPTFQKIAGSFEWHLFPSANPDGYVYTHTSDRMWRKTRMQYGSCYGADPNRNWNAHWMEQGTSNQPCSDTYGGPRAFSEIETSSLSSYIANIGSRMDVYLSFHSYSQLLLLPYGHTTQHLDNYNQMMQIGRKAIAALASRYGTVYQVGNIAETIYPASGGSIDWVKQQYKTNVVAAYELRDTGRYGFLLPANQIIPNNLEVLDSLIAMLQEAESLGYVTIG